MSDWLIENKQVDVVDRWNWFLVIIDEKWRANGMSSMPCAFGAEKHISIWWWAYWLPLWDSSRGLRILFTMRLILSWAGINECNSCKFQWKSMKFTLMMLPPLAYYTPLLGNWQKALSPTTFSLRLWFWFAMPKALRLAFRVTFLVLLWKSGTKILFFQKQHANFQRIISLKLTDISIML